MRPERDGAGHMQMLLKIFIPVALPGIIAATIGSPAMNFIPCRLEENGSSLQVRLSDTIALPVPDSQATRYRPSAGRELIFGLGPEHITEPRRGERDEARSFNATLDVVEPVGMETRVYFRLDGTEVCGRVDPASAGQSGETMRLCANTDQMHPIDPRTDAVL